MKQRSIVGMVIGTLLLAGSLHAADEGWMTDFEAAKQAASTNRLILADFSGSDWCGWCMKLDKEVFSQPAFKAFAKEHLVLFLADFPRRKEQSATVQKQNEALSERYDIQGFPTVLLLDAGGNVVARTGYKPGGAEKYVEHLRELMTAGKK